jgi:pantetheine-phosphate adenylyltransferase
MVALSGDPVTFGHLDIIRQAKALCREVVVLVADNPEKTRTFSSKERAVMVERAIREAGIGGVRTVGWPGLLVDAWMREDCDALFRGVRNGGDRAYEQVQAYWNAFIHPAIKERVVMLDASPGLEQVSSSMVKFLVSKGIEVDKFVPMFVKRRLEEKLLRHYKIGVTGDIAVGKSAVAKEIVRRCEALDIPAAHINIDELLRVLYEEDTPGAQAVRDELGNLFGPGVLSGDRQRVERKTLAGKLFSEDCSHETRAQVIALTMPHVHRLYRDRLLNIPKGLIVVEWAQMAEMDMSGWVNHNTIVVDSADRLRFAEKRGISPKRLGEFMKYQWSADEKWRVLMERVTRDHHGATQPFLNRWCETPDEMDVAYAFLTKQILKSFPGLKLLRRTAD